MEAEAGKRDRIHDIIRILRKEVRSMTEPIVTEISKRQRDPFQILISTILSLRTKDEVTRHSSERLFEKARTPDQILAIPEEEIARLIFPVGFYKTKARRLKEVCKELIERHGGRPPDDLDELLKLPGVGRKTANLVITLGYRKPGICVDTHVHRVSNRLGYVEAKTPEQTEMALREKLPQEYWIEYNDLLVTWGQNICTPISPFCSKCAIRRYCRQIGVTRHR